MDFKHIHLTIFELRFNIESFAFEHLTEMEENSARSYTKVFKLVIRELSLIKHKEINFVSIV